MGVTIKDVAEAAGVSISTVSKVLNGHYSISEKTAERVRGIMREMNYYPNANAQSFASGSNHTVVLLANLAPNAAFQNPHMFEIISGLEEALCKRGYRLILRGADATSACGIAEEIISRRSADAIAVHVGVMSHPLAAVLTRLQFPHIVLGAPDFDSQVCWIDNSNTYSGTVAASFLLSRGYKRLAFIGGKSYDLGSALRLQGVKQGLSNAGAKLEDQYIWLGESTRADGFRMVENLLSQKELPDAIICANNYIALENRKSVESIIKCRRNRYGFSCIIFLSEGRRKEVKTLNGYSYLTLEQRREIERMYAEGERVVDIAARLKRSAAAIYEELKRGYTGEFDGYARPKYSADLAQATVQENFRRRGNRRGANC